MHKFSFLILLFPLLQTHTASEFPVDIKLIGPLNTDRIQIQVDVKNLSPTSVMVLKRRIQCLKRNTTSFSGNYIIEIEKKGANGYYLFEPIADKALPDHATDREYIPFQKEKTIRDTLVIYWRWFTNGTSQKIFPGQYRIRVSFNPTEWSSAQVNNSNWIEFVLD